MNEEVKQAPRNNPLIEKNKTAIPGVTFRLPSRGTIYEEGVLDDSVENGEVTVWPMRLKEEIKMKSPDSILQGTAVSETISYCVPQILDPMALCPEDVDYLLIAIKKMTHGSTITFKDVCMKLNSDEVDMTEENVINEMEESERTQAEEAVNEINKIHGPDSEESDTEETKETDNENTTGNINNLGENSKVCEFKISLDYFINNSKEIDYEKYKENCITEYNNFEIEFHPVTFKDYKDASVMDLQENPNMSEEEYFNYINERSNKNLTDRIKRVDTTTDKELIYEWIDTLSLKDREELFERIMKIQDWGVDFEYNLTCQKCGMSKKTTQSHINPLYFFLTS
jgi:hypothetical protein